MIQTQPQRLAFTGLVNLLKFLRQADDRNFFEAQFFDLLARGIELPLAPVDQDEIGKCL